ncbi:MAG TPA: queuosine salvage family protein [Phycisphaerae bacterium]|nr:queuosine salvage family protein [Phycisphaerae bacterium]
MIVLDSTRTVMQQAKLVSIDETAIERWAREISPVALKPSGHELIGQLSGSQEGLANLVLLVDALNFCFWSSNPLRFEWRGKTYERYEAMFVSLMLAARYEPRWGDAEYWVSVPSEELRDTLSGKGELLLLDEREQIVRETGRVLLERFDGQFINAIESVSGKAWPLAVLLMTEFDSFRDVARYHGQTVYLMKRAQICPLDIAACWQAHGFHGLSGLEELTAFADYRVPQALRHLGILQLESHLAELIDREEEIEAGSDGEIEIRAATIRAVDRMKNALESTGKRVAAWEIDWYLWALGRGGAVEVKHHRTRTVYY